MHDYFDIQHFVGESIWTERIQRRIVQVARYSYPVLITGPRGSGKSFIARAIHMQSPRGHQPLIPFTCGQLPTAFAGVQLFGHAAESGPLTRNAGLGCLGAAQRGTLLLEEVGDLDLASQDRLLRVLKDKRMQPVGETVEEAADVRIIATSSRDLGEAVRQGRFRFPLLEAINLISLCAIPLSERKADIAPLATHLLARMTLEQGLESRSLTAAAVALFEAHDWPGNVDELEHVLESAILASSCPTLDLDDFAEWFETVQPNGHRQDVRRASPACENRSERVKPSA